MTTKTNRIQDFNSAFPHPVKSDSALRGGKGHVARTHKTVMFVRTVEEAEAAIKQYGKTMVKVEIFPELEHLTR